MARSIDKGGQDIALHHMEKLAKSIQTKKEPTIKEQIAFADLPGNEQRKRMDTKEYNIERREQMINNSNRRLNIQEKLFNWVIRKYSEDLEEFRKTGASWSEIRTFMLSKQIEYINL